MVRGPPPVEFNSWLVVPIVMALMTSSVDEQSLRPVRESGVVPFPILKSLLDNLLPRQIS